MLTEMRAPRSGPATTCTNHCSQCGRHFHSVRAFDLHHRHDESGWPVCLDPIDIEDRDGKVRLIALTDDGECRMYPLVVERGVTVWSTPEALADRERLSGLTGDALSASGVPG